jgi:hypothetical protein
MPFSHDARPIVGECTSLGFDGLWLACGFGAQGIMEGPQAAAILANRLVSRLAETGTVGCAPEAESSDATAVLEAMDPGRPGCCARSVETSSGKGPTAPQIYSCVLESVA